MRQNLRCATAAPAAEAPKRKHQRQKLQKLRSKAAPAATSYAAETPSPAARKILDEKNIAPATVSGTGKGGRITKDDAVNAVPSMGTPTGGSRGTERTKLSMLRRKVAERLVSAKNETAMLTTFNEVNMTAIIKFVANTKMLSKQNMVVRFRFHVILYKSSY
jgi:2-oxoglutarate dehydrogenase E2 component (dihydrolipoamide succinyltransferase)